jgi:hypothetical protein
MKTLKIFTFLALFIFLGIFAILSAFRHFTIDYLVICLLFWSAVNLFGIVFSSFFKKKTTTIFAFLLVVFFTLFIFLELVKVNFFLRITLIIFYAVGMVYFSIKKIYKKNLRKFLIALQIPFSILIILTIVNIEFSLLGTDFKSSLGRASGFIEYGFVFFILYLFLYYSGEMDIEMGAPGYGETYKKRLLILPLSIFVFFSGCFFLLMEYKKFFLGFIVGLIGALVIPTLVLLLYVKKKYNKYG